MTDQTRYIAKPPVLKPAEDFYRLRQEGISFIEEMGTDLWTDYNAHDPGMTILEAFCYGITELAYRTGWDIKDILTPDPAEKKAASAAGQQASNKSDVPYPGQHFPTAREILTVNPVTPDDFRRLLISLEGVRNAWVTPTKCDLSLRNLENFAGCEEQKQNKKEQIRNSEKEEVSTDSSDVDKMPFCGLYDVLLELEEEFNNDENKDKKIDAVKIEAKKLLHLHRNLCEDFCHIKEVNVEHIAVCAEIEVRPDVDRKLMQAQVLWEIEKYFSPPIPFYSLQELIDAGEKVEDIFNGPDLSGGFIKAYDLEAAALKDKLYTSDLINILMDIDGIITIRHLRLFKCDNGNIVKSENPWVISLQEHSRAKLWKCSKEYYSQKENKKRPSRLTFYQNGVPFQQEIECDEMINPLFGGTERSKDETAADDDIPIPTGTFRNLNEYFPVQYSLPTAYGIGPDGLPAQASDERRARAKQLQGYLMPFEQILANAFSQLEHVGDLFSLDQEVKESYFVKDIDETILREVGELFRSSSELPEDDSSLCLAADKDREVEQDCSHCYYGGQKSMPLKSNAGLYAQRAINEILSKDGQAKRRNCFIDHLLARFGEQIEQTVLVQKNTAFSLLDNKISFLKFYQKISADKGKAFDYTKSPCGNNNAIGLKKRICSLLNVPSELSFIVNSTNSFWKNYYNVKFNLKDNDNNIWLQGSVAVSSTNKDEAQCIAEKKILEQTAQKRSYEINQENNKFRLKLRIKFKNTSIYQICKYPSLFESKSDAEKFIDRLIQWATIDRTTISRMIIVEHILLRSGFHNPNFFCKYGYRKAEDYFFRMTVLIPGWLPPYNTEIEKRNVVEQIIQQETPAHLLVKIFWLDKETFECFEEIWYYWMKVNFNIYWAEDCIKKQLLKKYDELSCCILVELNNMRNLYPVGRLHDWEDNNNVNDGRYPVRLGKTVLGNC